MKQDGQDTIEIIADKIGTTAVKDEIIIALTDKNELIAFSIPLSVATAKALAAKLDLAIGNAIKHRKNNIIHKGEK